MTTTNRIIHSNGLVEFKPELTPWRVSLVEPTPDGGVVAVALVVRASDAAEALLEAEIHPSTKHWCAQGKGFYLAIAQEQT
jgi:hypothetical protein